MLEKLQAKRAVLVAQRDQIMANYNLTSGAIAIVDELIGEVIAEAAAEALAQKPAETETGMIAPGVHDMVLRTEEQSKESATNGGVELSLAPPATEISPAQNPDAHQLLPSLQNINCEWEHEAAA